MEIYQWLDRIGLGLVQYLGSVARGRFFMGEGLDGMCLWLPHENPGKGDCVTISHLGRLRQEAVRRPVRCREAEKKKKRLACHSVL